MKKPTVTLSNEDAMILQQISESGEEDVTSLAASLGIKRKKVMSSLQRLKSKGLIVVKHVSDDWWVYMSGRGKELMHYVWPEMSTLRAF